MLIILYNQPIYIDLRGMKHHANSVNE